MEWYEVELDGRRTVAFPNCSVPGIREEQVEPADYLGGIIHDGHWGWVTCRYASDASLLVCRLATGDCVARHTFWSEHANEDEAERSSISCVEELFTDQPDRPVLLAVCLESWDGGQRRPDSDQLKVRSQVHLYCIDYGQVLRRLSLNGLLCSSLAYLEQRICCGTQLARFDGCLAVATVEGIVLLVDLNYEDLLAAREASCPSPGAQPAQGELHRITGDENMLRIDDLLDACRDNGVHLTVELDVARVGIRCLISIGLVAGFAAGLSDGRILIYDLVNFQLITALRPPKPGLEFGAVARLCVIMPPDDPKPCFYICAMYQGLSLSMLLHSVNYSYVRHDGFGYRFERFYSTSVRNHQILDSGHCSVMNCSTASTFSFAGDNGTLLAILAWHSHTQRQNKLVLFDMNQWYKDEMPECVRPYEKPHYLAGYILSGLPTGLALLLRPTSILHFVALQRYEEHFYPESLTFDCCVLTSVACRYYAHDGVQRRFLNALRRERATLFLRPQPCHEDIVRLRLLPQFCELNADATFSKSAMYEVILSVALEHGCTALLDDCARSWQDGSFLCNMLDPTELSLATLTNWIVHRARHIKRRISQLCQGIFDYGGYPLDERERREFEVLSEQMCELVRLQSQVLKLGRRGLPSAILRELEDNERALQAVHEYQKVLYWLIRQGILPEGRHEQEQQQQPPLVALRRSYEERRSQRRRLYIDTLTEQTGLAGGAYPPDTLQALLYEILDTDKDLARKHELILYMLLDLNPEMAKHFPLAFQMHEPNVISVRCFWWLDRGDYQQCMVELYDKQSNSPKDFEAWQTRFLVETLMEAGDVKSAMRVVREPPGSLTAALEMDVLLANNCVPEAFHNARLALDEKGQPLVERFFRRCIENKRFKVLAELCLTEHEEQLVYRLLQECRSRQTECVQLILLLQKSKYIEAVNFMDDVAARRQRASTSDASTSSIMSAYRSTMAPVTQNIAGTYFRIRGKLDEGLDNDGPNADHRQPLSCQLVRQNASGQLGGIYQSSAISALWAEHCQMADSPGPPQLGQGHGQSNIPFLRTEQYGFSGLPQRLRTVRPVPHQLVGKRQRELEERDQDPAGSAVQPRKRRRLLAEQLMDDIRGRVDTILGQQSEPGAEQGQYQLGASDLVQPPTFLQATTQPPVCPPAVVIPTILKRRPALPLEPVVGTPPSATSTSLPLSQSKRFRFQPPIPLRVPSEDEDEGTEEPEEEEAAEEEEETDEIIMEIESRSGPRSAYSAESDEEEEVFLSPLASATVSRVSHLSGVPAETGVAEVSPRLMAPPAGPQPRGSLLQVKPGTGIGSGTGSESSSGFGSFATVQPAQTTSHSQFVPTVCSSKMYETQSQAGFAAASYRAKISERTTICGDMESTDLVGPESTGQSVEVAASSLWSMPTARLSGQALRMLDTTLDMSTYDTTSLEQQEQVEGVTTELVPEESKAEEESEPEEEQELEEEPEPEQRELQEEEVSKRSQPVYHQMEPSLSEMRRLGQEVEPMSFNDEESENELRQPQEIEEEEELVVEESEPEPEPEPETLSRRSLSSGGSGSEDEDEEIQLVSSESEESENENDENQEQQEPQAGRSEPDYQQMSYLEARSRGSVPAPIQDHLSSPTRSLSSDLSTPELRRQRREVELVTSNDEESTGSITTSRSVTHTPEGTFLPSDTQNSSPRAAHGAGGDGSLYRANSLETVDDLDTTKGSLEEDEEEDEDDCVIALDGTEVRGYVARPQQATASSSAELFAFKDECADETAPGPCPSLSLGATVNSDSVAADIIDLDSDEESGEQEQQPEREPQQEEQPQQKSIQVDEPEMGVEDVVPEVQPEIIPEEQQPEEQGPTAAESGHDPDPQLISPQEEDSRQSLTLAFSEEEDAEVAAATALTPSRNLRPRRNTSEHQDSPILRRVRVRLRSDDSGGAPSVTTPKRRVQKHRALLEVIDEQGSLDTSLPRTRSRSRLCSVDTDAADNTPTQTAPRSRRSTSLAPASERAVESPQPRRSLRGISEPPVTPQRSLRSTTSAPKSLGPTVEPTTKPPVRTLRTRSRKNSANDSSPAVSPVPSEPEQPRLRRTARRRTSELSDAGSGTSSIQGRELRSRKAESRPVSPSSERASRTPTPTEGSSEAHVPPKKRGRPKRQPKAP